MTIEADTFLRHMVRTLVGTMVEIGIGERAPADLTRLLEGAPREEAGITAPARGLFLWDIKYADSAQAAGVVRPGASGVDTPEIGWTAGHLAQ